jgi:hypothetical protein
MGAVGQSFTHSQAGVTENLEHAMHTKPQRVLPYPLWFGGSASCMAVCITHPLDLGIVGHLVQHCQGG